MGTLGMSDEDFEHLNMRAGQMQEAFAACMTPAPVVSAVEAAPVLSEAEKRSKAKAACET